MLVMNGNDHAEPDARSLRAAEGSGRTRAVQCRGRHARRIREAALRGFRSTARRASAENCDRRRVRISPPGVSSSRAWIKQRDFQISYLLERIADPLTALASRLNQSDDLTALLEVAWRTEIQNHPHDSICGCSIDQVHQDMRYRFDQAEMIGEIVARRASSTVLSTRSGGEAATAVFNPTFARRALVTGETEVEDPHASYVAVDSDGRRIPVAIDIARLGAPIRNRAEGRGLQRIDHRGAGDGPVCEPLRARTRR